MVAESSDRFDVGGGVYVEHGQFGTDRVATSCLLPGLSLEVAQRFRAGTE